ncbi:unnamed protein product [Rhizoctonia solani]|uniref:Secreted protein n=1 Tax=Rhizoctonia solani TaxID=456999 RepID=A0A8H3DRS8_9AGAM|nr:unnamed protein product [Rhizoctonia solani]
MNTLSHVIAILHAIKALAASALATLWHPHTEANVAAKAPSAFKINQFSRVKVSYSVVQGVVGVPGGLRL